MAQRLVRTICPECKTTFVPDHDELPMDFPLKKGAPKPAPDIAIQQGMVEMMAAGQRQRREALEGDRLPGVPAERATAAGPASTSCSSTTT